MTTYLTQYDPETRQPMGPSQRLTGAGLDEAAGIMGPPDVWYKAMLIYRGPLAFCVTRFALNIDGPSNSGQNETKTDQQEIV